ncbi:hypothetical protein KY333_04495 [Candidatus Woesearchaeota archaeon]|nr:hypothetical protein [Candidatus Woesearchaeota archaeon]MBW2993839.1 hypothetical protein [Candidatus Woesearchaeota archaeon]
MVTQTEIVDRTYGMWGADLAPPIIFDTAQDAIAGGLGDEYAGFDMKAHNLMVNKQKISKNLGWDFFEVILSHEVGHYDHSPRDLENMIILLHEAKEVVGDLKLAKYVENLFTDTIVNSFIYKNDSRNRQKLVELYNKMSPLSEKKPEAWQVYLRTYEKLWNLSPNTLVSQVTSKAEKAADNIHKMMAPKSIDDVFDQPQWKDKVRKYAEEMKPFINAEKEQSDQQSQGQGKQNSSQNQNNNQGQGQGQGQKQGNQKGNGQQQGQGSSGQGNQGQATPGQGNAKKELGSGVIIHKHDPKKYKQDEKTFGKVAEQIGKDAAKQIYAGLGLGNPRNLEDALINSLAEVYKIILPRARSSRSGKRFIGHGKTKRLQDTNILYSKSTWGIIAPGITTFADKFKMASTKCGRGVATPDLNLLLDTSGSMQGSAYYSVLAAKIAANSTLHNGGAVCVYNFSRRCIGHTDGFQRDKKKVYRLIEHQQSGGTIFPTRELIAGIKKNKDNPQYVLVITDTGFGNVQGAAEALQQVDNQVIGGAFFLVNTYVPLHAELKKTNYEFIPVTDNSLAKETRLRMKKVV